VNPQRWQQIKIALHRALQLHGASRLTYINDIAANDPELRQELESLIAVHDGASDSFLNIPAAAIERIAEIDGPDPWVGKRIGAYQLIEQVGSGGMGEVYRAIRVDDEYQKQVAIKLIRVGKDSAFVVQRFRNERQILASFEHPNIARLLDGGTTAEGLPYFAMEFIEGEPIDIYCDRTRLDISARLHLFLQVCGAVQYAHQRLIVHRDLKPNNILVGADGVPKLLDFGIAKILELGAGSESTAHTKTNFTMLTPAYASPEQATGQPITTSSDVYS
jgi:serine/threonine protein kinase